MSNYALTNGQRALLCKIVRCDDKGSLREKGYINLSFGDDEYRIWGCGNEPVSLNDLEELAGLGLLEKIQQKPHYRYRITNAARIAIKNNSEASSPVTPNMVYLSGDFRGSNLNIGSTLTNANQSINTFPDVDKGLASKDTLAGEETKISESLRRQLLQHQSNLNELREQSAIYGFGETPLHLIHQIKHEEDEITKLEDQLTDLSTKKQDEVDDRLSKEQKVLLIAAAKRGEFHLLYTEQTSTWVRVGGKDFHDDNDPSVAVIYLEAFRELCRYGYIAKEGGLYSLTGSGFKVARRLAGVT